MSSGKYSELIEARKRESARAREHRGKSVNLGGSSDASAFAVFENYYQRAKELMEKNEPELWSEAAEIFYILGEYRDSEDLLDRCKLHVGAAEFDRKHKLNFSRRALSAVGRKRRKRIIISAVSAAFVFALAIALIIIFAPGAENTGELVIPAETTVIADNAYRGDKSISSVIIPGSVSYIGDNAFKDCSNLQTVYIPSSVQGIADSAFEGCNISRISVSIEFLSRFDKENFKYVTILAGDAVPASAFRDCYKLESVELNGGIKSIGDSAFCGCESLSAITLPYTVETIDRYAFYGCRLLSAINMPQNLQLIGSSAFGGCAKLKEITLPQHIKKIGSFAFQDCASIEKITFKDHGTWYCTQSFTEWDNRSGGSKIDIDDPLQNAKYFCGTHRDYFWYHR